MPNIWKEQPVPLVLAAYAAIYILWGTTYLAGRIAVSSIPPLMVGTLRFGSAGLILMGCAWMRGARTISARNWLEAAKVGSLAITMSYSLLICGMVWVPSGIASLIIGLEPLNYLLVNWLFFKGPKPTLRDGAIMALGFAGAAALVFGNRDALLSEESYIFWIVVIFISSYAWVFGNLMNRNRQVHPDLFMSAGMQMATGGAMLLIASVVTGDWARMGSVTPEALWSMAYMVTLGSVIPYTAFVWLMKVDTVNHVAAHAFVNPVVAVFVGWLIGGEAIGPEVIVAGIMIVGSVALSFLHSGRE